MRLLLVSTYELGHQPLHLASPAAALQSAGHDVETCDVSVAALDGSHLDSADAVAISVPMHTAARLAQDVVAAVRRIRPDLPLALYGLYAGEGAFDGVTARFVGEYEPQLVEWADTGFPPVGVRISLATGTFGTPLRDGLPDLGSYGRLEVDGEAWMAGYVEASHGCRHRCRHCPIPAVYDGRYRIVGADSVLSDIDAQVDRGARHITWGDPDFLNGPRHAVDLLEEAHRRHPHLTHDLTIKVEHLRRHASLLPRIADAGVLFIVSAFESTDDRTLRLLDKGHTASDMSAAVELVRDHGMEIHPSWMPFVPWTVPSDVVGIFRFLDTHDLLGSTDPVQLSIRLLIPQGSLMLGLDEVASVVQGYDPDLLSYRWVSADPRADVLQEQLAALAEAGAETGRDPVATLLNMWEESCRAANLDPAEAQPRGSVTRGRPRLSESWFCCAEPTSLQVARVTT